MKRASLLAVVPLAGLVALTGWVAPAFAFDEVFERTLRLPAGGTFSLVNVNGSVLVEGWERDEVQVRAVKTARQDQHDLARVQIEVEAKADAVAVRTRYPRDEGVEVAVEYRVRVPSRVLLGRVETVNGNVRIRGVEGAGDLRSVNGNVELADGAGRFSARTTNGSIRLELRQLVGDAPMSVETVNGSIVLALPADAGAELDVRTLNGDFRSELPVTLQGSADSRGFRGKLGAGGATLRVRAVNGPIVIAAARPTV